MIFWSLFCDFLICMEALSVGIRRHCKRPLKFQFSANCYENEVRFTPERYAFLIALTKRHFLWVHTHKSSTFKVVL